MELVRGRGAPAVTTSRPKRCGSSGAGQLGETHLSHIRPAATSNCPRVNAAGRVHYKRGHHLHQPRWGPLVRSHVHKQEPCFRVLRFRSGGQRCSHPGRWKDEGIGRERLGDPVRESNLCQRQDLAAGLTAGTCSGGQCAGFRNARSAIRSAGSDDPGGVPMTSATPGQPAYSTSPNMRTRRRPRRSAARPPSSRNPADAYRIRANPKFRVTDRARRSASRTPQRQRRR